VSNIFTATYIAEYGTLGKSQEVECIFVRSEEVYTSANSGTVNRAVGDGQLVRASSLVATVDGKSYYNDIRGLVSYYSDGYESKITPENMTELTIKSLSTYKETTNIDKELSQKVEAGDVIYKIVENNQWYLVYWVKTDEAESLSIGQSVTVDFGNEENVSMTVLSITEQETDTQVILSCNRNYEDFDKYRVKECTIITSSNSGIILNTDSIVEKDGVKGVYVIDKFNNENFTPIRILGTQGDKTVVAKNYFYDAEGNSVHTVETYNEILKSPSKTK
jgi:putative membrane fusion protein